MAGDERPQSVENMFRDTNGFGQHCGAAEDEEIPGVQLA